MGDVSISGDGKNIIFDANSSEVNALAVGEVLSEVLFYDINDGTANSNLADFRVSITGVNDAPVANADTAQVDKDESVVLNVILNDSDVDGDLLSVTGVTQGEKGFAELNAAGDIVYTPNPNALSELNDGEKEVDTFTYTVSDGSGGVVEGNASVTILGINDAPTAVNDAVTITSRTKLVSIDVLENDFDPDSASANDIISLVSFTQPNQGVVGINKDGELVYTPAPGIFFDLGLDETASDNFSYTISDTKGLTSSTEVNIEVLGVTDIKISLGEKTPAIMNLYQALATCCLARQETTA